MNTRLIYSTTLLLTLFAPGCDDEPEQDSDTGSDADSGSAGDDGDDPPTSDPSGAAPFFLPTGEEADNTSAPRVEVDADGGVHALYPAYAGGDAYYAYCPAGCDDDEDVSVVRLPTNGTTANAMLVLDAEGRPRVLLDAFAEVYWASCDENCGDASNWTTSSILVHDGEQEVTGEALALDPQGRPRFVMHTYRAFLGIGQGAPETWLVSCDENCHAPESWTSSRIAEQIWQSNALRYDAEGHAHLAMVATVVGTDGAASQDIGAYGRCDADCENADSWLTTGIMSAFSTEYDAFRIEPAISLALTSRGTPRIAMLGVTENGVRGLTYLACDDRCATDGWMGTILWETEDLGPGVDLALGDDDRPRLAYTYDYNIGIGHCDAEQCELADSPWTLGVVEAGSEMDPDDIFLENCTIAAWFLHSPSIAISPDGLPRVGYQARDVSGGEEPDPYDPTEPECVAGTDMTWARLAMMGQLE